MLIVLGMNFFVRVSCMFLVMLVFVWFCVFVVDVFRCGVIIICVSLNSGLLVYGLVVNMFRLVVCMWLLVIVLVSVVLFIRLLCVVLMMMMFGLVFVSVFLLISFVVFGVFGRCIEMKLVWVSRLFRDSSLMFSCVVWVGEMYGL